MSGGLETAVVGVQDVESWQTANKTTPLPAPPTFFSAAVNDAECSLVSGVGQGSALLLKR